MKSASTYEKLRKRDEAIASYRELIDKFPESPLAGAAREKVGVGE